MIKLCSPCTAGKFAFTDFSKGTEMFFITFPLHLRTLKLTWSVKALKDP